jgi:REP element-mobilizing transposase RayT
MLPMARAWRIEFAGALYHVLSRGNERRPIFADDRDRSRFLDLLAQSAERFDVEICAYVLMPNHYHLLLRTRHPNLSRAMQWLGVSYTARFNRRHNRVGHLFQGRFKSILVQNEAYLLQLSWYIHRNPVRAGLVERLADYRWSSYRAYAYGNRQCDWLDTGLILSQMVNAGDPCKAYRSRALAYAREEKSLWDDLRHGFVLGSEEFVDRLKAQHLPHSVHREIPQQKRIADGVFPVAALRRAAAFLECDLDKCRLRGKVARETVQARDLLIYLVWQGGGQSNVGIGSRFGLTPSAVSRRIGIIKSELQRDPELRDRFEQLIRVLKALESAEGA